MRGAAAVPISLYFCHHRPVNEYEIRSLITPPYPDAELEAVESYPCYAFCLPGTDLSDRFARKMLADIDPIGAGPWPGGSGLRDG